MTSKIRINLYNCKFMSELSGIPMNYEEKYPTLNSMCYSTNTNHQKKSNPAAYISGDRIRRYSRNTIQSTSTRKELWLKFIVTRQRALVDFNVEFASW
jgi:hypothetical protein